MIKFEHTETVGWDPAIRGMRNPMNSWEKSDSSFSCEHCEGCYYEPENNTIEFDGTDVHWCSHTKLFVGPNDLDLMTRLRRGGSDDRKFMRMLAVYVDITAPLYWWKEFDTYKVGTVANSCSTMHKIHVRPFTRVDFSHEQLEPWALEILDNVIWGLNCAREYYVENKNKADWWQMIQLLPTSYNQKRTVMLNYEVLANMYHSRKNHKLDEWHTLCDWISTLPYAKELIIGCHTTK